MATAAIKKNKQMERKIDNFHIKQVVFLIAIFLYMKKEMTKRGNRISKEEF